MQAKILCAVAVFAAGVSYSAGMAVDFSRDAGRIRRALHSSGFAPKSTSGGNIAAQIKELNFDYVRT